MPEIVRRRTPCPEREPAEKHDWRDGGTRDSGYNVLKRWKCKKCGATTTNEERRYLT